MNWERTSEQRLEARRYRQRRRRQNRGGHRRQSRRQARQEYGNTGQAHARASPAWSHTSRLAVGRAVLPVPLRLASAERLEHHTQAAATETERRRRPPARGSHGHCARYPQLERWPAALELAAANRAGDTRRPLLLCSAACLACDGNLPNQVELITAYALSRYPIAARLRWAGRDELVASRQRQALDDEQLLSRALIRIAVTAGGLAEHYQDIRPVSEQISALAWRIHNQRMTHQVLLYAQVVAGR